MAKKRPKLEVIFEYKGGKDSEQRLQQAFEILFEGITVDPEVVQGLKAKDINRRKRAVKTTSSSGL